MGVIVTVFLKTTLGITARLGTRAWLWLQGWVAILVLMIFVAGTAGTFWHLYHRVETVNKELPLQGTELQVLTLQEFRRVYSEEVVERAKHRGVLASHDPVGEPGTIPLPATLTMKLGDRIAEHRPGARVRLYSEYPFPWRTDGGPRDDFEREALRALRENPDQPFYRFEEFEGRASLRYAVADRMQAGCVSCHNSRPDSPKKDWQVGDVRGVLEFVRPLDRQVETGRAAQRSGLLLTGSLAGFGLLGLGLVYARLRQTAGVLSERANQSALAADVAIALTNADDLNALLQQCTEAMVRHLGAAFARIWTLNEAENVLELQASAGMYTHRDGPHARVPVGQFEIGRIAQDGKPHLTNSVFTDPWVGNPEWARREGLAAFAGYPLIVGGRVVGVMAMLAKRPLTNVVLHSLAVAADSIALGIVRKRAEEAVRTGEDRLKAVFETATDGIVIIDQHGLIETLNPAMLRLFGYSPGELVGRNISTLLPEPRQTNHENCPLAAHVLGDKREVLGRRKDGTEFPLELSVSKSALGGRQVFIGVAQDITERKHAEEAVRASEERFRNLVEHATDAILLCNTTGAIVHVNRQACESLGYTRDQLVGMNLSEIDADMTPAVLESLAKQINSDLQSTAYRQHRRNDGFVFPVEFRARLFEMDGERFVMAVVRDVTERKQAEAILRASEERYRLLFDANPHPMWVHDAITFRFLAVNDAAVRYYGYSRAQFDTMTVLDIDTAPAASWEAVAAATHEAPQVHCHRPASGEARQVEVAAHPIEFDYQFAHLVLAIDVTDRKKAEEAVRASEERFRSLVEQVPDAIFVNDSSGVIVDANLRACESLGYAREELIGLTISDINIDYSPEVIEMLTPALIAGEVRTLYGRQKRKDGSLFPVEVRPRLFEMNDRRFAVSIVRDITERKQFEEALLEAKEKAEAANRLKSEFLANMSHEIRTPMNGVLGMTELILETELTPEQRESVLLVKSSADALLTVINDILDFSKIEAGKLDLDPMPFAVREVVGDTLKTLAARAHAKGLELACDAMQDVPDLVLGDAHRLRQVLTNLVGNAIKFTEQGEVVVRSERIEEPGDAHRLRFSVADTGIGIPANKIRTVFEPFTQADGSTTRKYGGTGLGLTICQRLVELMGGRIWAESKPGRGSTFCFEVRLERASGSAVRRVEKPVDLKELSVLIVDDNATNRRVLAEMLRHWGAKPTCSASGPEALDELRWAAGQGTPYALVLLDGMMPEMDGFMVAERIVREPTLVLTKILMLTSADRQGDAARCRDLGVAAYLVKPVKHAELNRAITAAFQVPDSEHGSSKLGPAVPAKLTDEPAVHPLRVLVAEDNLVNQRVIIRLLEKFGHAVTVAGDGRQALAALERDRFDVVFMDVQMPEMDGFEATRIIREREAETGQHMPIVAMTAHAMKGDRERCLAAGMDDYVPKPVQRAELLRVLTWAAGVSPAAPVAPAPAAVTDTTPPREVLPALDRAAALERLGGDEELFAEIADVFRGDAPKMMDEIRRAVAAGDDAWVRRAAHGLKGAAGYVGGKPAADAAAILEKIGASGDLAEATRALDKLNGEVDRLTAALAPTPDAVT